MDEPTTRPGALGRAEAQRIALETAAVLRSMNVDVENNREYREKVLVMLARGEVKQDNLRAAFDDHVRQDTENFRSVHQSIGGTINGKTVVLALSIISAVGAFVGFVIFLVNHVAKP